MSLHAEAGLRCKLEDLDRARKWLYQHDRESMMHDLAHELLKNHLVNGVHQSNIDWSQYEGPGAESTIDEVLGDGLSVNARRIEELERGWRFFIQGEFVVMLPWGTHVQEDDLPDFIEEYGAQDATDPPEPYRIDYSKVASKWKDKWGDVKEEFYESSDCPQAYKDYRARIRMYRNLNYDGMLIMHSVEYDNHRNGCFLPSEYEIPESVMDNGYLHAWEICESWRIAQHAFQQNFTGLESLEFSRVAIGLTDWWIASNNSKIVGSCHARCWNSPHGPMHSIQCESWPTPLPKPSHEVLRAAAMDYSYEGSAVMKAVDKLQGIQTTEVS